MLDLGPFLLHDAQNMYPQQDLFIIVGNHIRAKKGNSQGKLKAVHKAISEDVAFPGDGFKDFLSVAQNKIQLQHMIGDALISHAPRNKCIVVSGAFECPTHVKCSAPNVNTDDLQSDHQEADTRLVVSVTHSAANHVTVDTNDTDVFIVLLSNYDKFHDKNVYMRQYNEGKCTVTSIGDVANGLVVAGLTPKSLPLLHSLTGCDTTSFMLGVTKKKAWSTYVTYHGLLDGIDSTQPSGEDIVHAEEFMAKLYKDTPCKKLDELRRDCMFTTNRQEEMPPTSDAAQFHIQRAFLQASIWSKAYIPQHGTMHNSLLYGGFTIESNTMTPVKSSKKTISKGVVEMVACNCKTACNSGKCACFKTGLKCTLLCHKQSRTRHLCKNRHSET